MRKFLHRWVIWFYSMIAAVITGTAHSIAPILIAPQTFNLAEGKTNLLSIFGISALIGVVTYIIKSPLPELPKELLERAGDTVIYTDKVNINNPPSPDKN